MYLAHFGLNEFPFSITPDTSFFFASPRYQEALNTLLVAARTGEGFIKLTGEVGTGKTLLCRKFMSSLGPEFRTAYITNPYLEPQALLLGLAEELGVKADPGISQHSLLKALTLALLGFAREGKRVLICLDEAQAMPLETMEALRLLTNLETGKRKLLQVVIFGQPELDEKLDQPSIRQLKQRITFDHQLGSLSRDDLQYYLNHRVTVAGYKGGRLFTLGALRLLHRETQGVPRLVNILSHKAMMSAYGKGNKVVDRVDVMAAAQDTGATRRRRRKVRVVVLLAAFALLATVAVVVGGMAVSK